MQTSSITERHALRALCAAVLLIGSTMLAMLSGAQAQNVGRFIAMRKQVLTSSDNAVSKIAIKKEYELSPIQTRVLGHRSCFAADLPPCGL